MNKIIKELLRLCSITYWEQTASGHCGGHFDLADCKKCRHLSFCETYEFAKVKLESKPPPLPDSLPLFGDEKDEGYIGKNRQAINKLILNARHMQEESDG